METTASPLFDLPVGDPVRVRIGRAVPGSLGMAVVFVVVTWLLKEIPALYAREPWQNDPYDAVVSAALWCVPLLVIVCSARAVMCRRFVPLPRRRAADAARLARLLVVVVAVTLVSSWAGVAVNAASWPWTGGVVGVLGLLTVLVAATLRPLRSAAGALRGGPAAGQPDGLADAIFLARSAAVWLAFGSGTATRRVDWADRRLAVRLRAHPLRASAIFAVAFGAVIDAPQVVIEGYPPALAVVFVAVSACSVFAFLAMAGAAVGWVERRRPRASTGGRVLVAAAASVPIAAAFRDALWPLIGVDPQQGGLGDLVTLMAAAAAATGLVASVTDATSRRMSR